MYNSIIQAQCVSMEGLQHLFIDLEYTKNQNKTAALYRSRSFNQKNKKYLQFDEVKDSLKEIDKNSLKYIYFVGKDPLSHADFNQILRLCLNFAPVTIYTDGNCINDKKARFLRRAFLVCKYALRRMPWGYSFVASSRRSPREVRS